MTKYNVFYEVYCDRHASAASFRRGGQMGTYVENTVFYDFYGDTHENAASTWGVEGVFIRRS